LPTSCRLDPALSGRPSNTSLFNDLRLAMANHSHATTSRRSAVVRLAAALGCAVFAGTLLLSAPAYAQSGLPTGVWKTTTAYPVSFANGSCVTSGGYIYCVGGTSGDGDYSYYARINPDGLGDWTATTPYGEGGTSNLNLRCVASGGYIYCVGGQNTGGQTGDVTSDVWYAPLGPGGIGPWTETADYDAPGVPIKLAKVPGVAVTDSSCVAAKGHIYCIGGYRTTETIYPGIPGAPPGPPEPSEDPVDYVLETFAMADGVPGWTMGPKYPVPAGHAGIVDTSCVADGDNIYCVGGWVGWDTDNVYYTHINDDGTLGPWNPTTPYGGGSVERLSCTTVAGHVYCVGGNSNEVWAAPLSDTGVGEWTRQPDYPTTVLYQTCVGAGAGVFCVGGNDSDDKTSYIGDLSFLELRDAASCGLLSGTWSDASRTCTVGTTFTLEPGQTLQIDPGVTLTTAAAPAAVVNNGTIKNQGTIVFPAGSGVSSNNGIFENDGVLVNRSTFENDGTMHSPGVFDNYGTFTNNADITMDGFQDGHFVNDEGGTLVTRGRFIASATEAQNFGTATVIVNSRTCVPADEGAIGDSDPFAIFATSDDLGICTIGQYGGTTLDMTVGRGITWQIPSSITLINEGRLSVEGSIENDGTFIDQPAADANGDAVPGTGLLGISGRLLINDQMLDQHGGIFLLLDV
jgi:hypothetical protein